MSVFASGGALEAKAELTDTKKFTDVLLIEELRRRGRLHVSDRKTNKLSDGWESLVKYETRWLTTSEAFVVKP